MGLEGRGFHLVLADFVRTLVCWRRKKKIATAPPSRGTAWPPSRTPRSPHSWRPSTHALVALGHLTCCGTRSFHHCPGSATPSAASTSNSPCCCSRSRCHREMVVFLGWGTLKNQPKKKPYVVKNHWVGFTSILPVIQGMAEMGTCRYHLWPWHIHSFTTQEGG